MSEDAGSIHQVITGMTTVATIFIGFVGRRFIGKVDDTADALAKHEKDDIGKYATMDQLTRVHTRIDESMKASDEGFREVRDGINGIKDILINKKH